MKTNHSLLNISAWVAAACVCLALAGRARTESVIWTIDTSRSLLDLSGSFAPDSGGGTFSPQSAGSLRDRFSGTITADLTGGMLTFFGGSVITAQISPSGLFQPGATTGNYGISIPAIAQFGAYRGLILDILSGGFASGGTPMISLSFSAGSLDYAGPVTGSGSIPLGGQTGADTSGAVAGLTMAGGVETLSIPVSFTFSGAAQLEQTLDGVLVATRPVPEPSTVLIGFAGLALFAVVRRFRGR